MFSLFFINFLSSTFNILSDDKNLNCPNEEVLQYSISYCLICHLLHTVRLGWTGLFHIRYMAGCRTRLTMQIHDNRIIPAFYFQISRIFYCTVLNQYPVYPFCRESNRGRGGGGGATRNMPCYLQTYFQTFCVVDVPRNYEREDENPFPGCQFRISLVQPHKKLCNVFADRVTVAEPLLKCCQHFCKKTG